MRYLPPLRTALYAVAALFTHASASAAPDLERILPVPATEPIPIEDFFRPPLFARAQLNLTGTHIAALISTPNDHKELLVYEIESRELHLVSGSLDNKDIYDFGWLDGRHLFFRVSTDKIYGVALLGMSVDRLKANWPLLQYCSAQILAAPRRNRAEPLVWIRSDVDGDDRGPVTLQAPGNFGKFIDLDRSRGNNTMLNDLEDIREMNQRRIIAQHPKLPGIAAGYLADREGELAFGFTAPEGLLKLHRLVDQAWAPCPIDLEQVSVYGSGDQPGEIIVSTVSQGDAPSPLQRMDAATGELKEVLLQDKRYDFTGWLVRDPDQGGIVGAMYDVAIPVTTWFDPGYRAVQKLVETRFPGQVVRLLGCAQGGKLFLVETWSDRQPSIYHILNLEKRELGLVKNSRPWIDPNRMRPMRMMTFRTEEGRELDAYLTLPANASKENPAPLVVLPHGGPWVRDSWGFDGEVQFLASRGYAVLQPNYRGSPGYNWMFPIDDQWEFLKMHADVTAATRKVLASGLVDPNRVAIMGGSFGGYLALSGVVHEPSLYRCAVTIAGVFDWEKLLKEKKYDRFDSPSYDRLLRKLGDPAKVKEKFDAISPVRHVEQVRVPMFVSHGKEDFIAPVSESKRLISALKKNQIPHEVFLVGGEGHGMSRFTNRVELYRRIEAFLAENLAPAQAKR